LDLKKGINSETGNSEFIENLSGLNRKRKEEEILTKRKEKGSFWDN